MWISDRNSQNIVALNIIKPNVFSKAILHYKVSVEKYVKGNGEGEWVHVHDSEWINLDCNDLKMVHEIQKLLNDIIQTNKINDIIK